MKNFPVKNRAPRWIAGIALVVAFVLSVLGLAAPGTSNPANAAAPNQGLGQAQASNNPVRRESGPPSNGPAPRTGPPSAFRPLDTPIFGDNYRANTDTQSPNLAQQEPSIAVNPTNPLNVVAAAKDERAGTNTKQVWIYTSTDGGVTWLNQEFPLAAPASPFSSDPIVSFSDDGQCYVTALPYGGGANDGIQVARSTDGGITFTTGVHLPGSNGSSDKEWTWVDNFPSSPYYHRIYTAWMNFGAGNVIASNYSTDRGITWSPLVSVGSANQFPMPVVLPNGNVILSDFSGNAVVYRRSTDGGQTFGGLTTVSPVTYPSCPPDNSGCGIWRMNPIPANSVDPTNGTMVATWTDGRISTNRALAYYSRSTDNGATWSPAAQIAPPGASNVYQVEPWVSTDELGNFHAIWYDDRDNPNTSIFNIYYSESTDDGATWSTAVRISTATTDLRIGIPSSYALAAGDYINDTASHGNVYAAWTDTRSGTGEDIYVVRGIYAGGTPTPTSTGTPPTATPTLTRTNTPTVTQTPCTTGAVVNGGFETGSFAPWAILSATPAPAVSTNQAHSGTHSAFLGSLPGTEPLGDASIYQQISVPASGGTLSYWYYPYSEDSITFDWQDAYITDASHNILATVMHVCDNTSAWTNVTFNMAPYAGQTVDIEFLVHQDGASDVTNMYVDDVALNTSCATGTPPTATNTGTNTPTSVPSVPASNTPTIVAPSQTPGSDTSTPAPSTTAQATHTAVGATSTPVPSNTPGVPTATPTACTLTFRDVPVGSTFYPFIRCLACKGIINGYPMAPSGLALTSPGASCPR